jgi:membrane protease subunit HflK
MAWNEPGGNKDPWGNKNNQDGPPDLDEIVKKVQAKFSGILGGKKSGGGGSGDTSGGSAVFLPLLIGIGLFVWLLSGIYIIDPAERGVELRFGQYTVTTGPGPHWHFPYPIEMVEKVNVDELREATHKATMLTKDENLLQIELAVQYQVNSAENYSFNVRDREKTMHEASESALREVVGSKKLDDIFSVSGGREVLVLETEKKIQAILETYVTGFIVRKVNMKSAQPPQEVQSAFEDAIKAREDEDRYKKQAEAYERDIIPKAEGDAQRLNEESEAYKQQKIARAEGESSRFLQTLNEYSKAPEITRKRLYLETMEEVLSRSTKVMVKVSGGNNIMYLPLDQIVKNARSQESGAQSSSSFLPEHGSIDSNRNLDTRSGSTSGREREGR